MTQSSAFKKIPKNIQTLLQEQNLVDLRPSQEKAIEADLFNGTDNMIVCSPTGSGKTLVAELALLDCILNKKKKALYIVPLKALASEKFKEFRKLYGDLFKIRIAVGEIQNEKYTYDYDLLIVTSEKLDALMRHNREVISSVGVLIIDEIHLLNDEKRGPTLEILLAIFKSKFTTVRIIGLSATIGNAKELSSWLEAVLIEDDFRPVVLEHHVLFNEELKQFK